MFRVVGELDAARAVALFRADNVHSVPLFAARGAPIVMTGMRLSEDVTSEALVFDYRLRHGRAAPRNALKVLKLAGVPADVVSSAYDVAAG